MREMLPLNGVVPHRPHRLRVRPVRPVLNSVARIARMCSTHRMHLAQSARRKVMDKDREDKGDRGKIKDRADRGDVPLSIVVLATTNDHPNVRDRGAAHSIHHSQINARIHHRTHRRSHAIHVPPHQMVAQGQRERLELLLPIIRMRRRMHPDQIHARIHQMARMAEGDRVVLVVRVVLHAAIVGVQVDDLLVRVLLPQLRVHRSVAQ